MNQAPLEWTVARPRLFCLRDFIAPSLITDRSNDNLRCEWAEVRAGESNAQERGSGLFANKQIRAFTRFDYLGVMVGKHTLLPKACTHCVTMCGSHFAIDAHPRWYRSWTPAQPVVLPRQLRSPERLPSGMLVCGLINEPVRRLGETPNMKIFASASGTYFVATRDINPGEELLTLYGPEDYPLRSWEPPHSWLQPEVLAAFSSFEEPLLFVYRSREGPRGPLYFCAALCAAAAMAWMLLSTEELRQLAILLSVTFVLPVLIFAAHARCTRRSFGRW